MKTWIRAALIIGVSGILLVPLLLRGAQEAPADPPAQSEAAGPAPAAAPPEGQEEEEELAPGDRLSADNNLSWPVDI
jgi:ribosomal protein L12E/L44/L45/RPP1/RPP2